MSDNKQQNYRHAIDTFKSKKDAENFCFQAGQNTVAP